MSSNSNSNSNANANSAASTATKKKVIKLEEWEKKLSEIKVNKSDLDTLVMNYLVIEGYKDAAEKFAQESGISPNLDLNTIEDRMNIRHAIQSGNVQVAIERVNELDPEILDTNPRLYFHLQQQRLIELIRQGNIEEALEFAQEELAPRGEENAEYLEEMEKTMALLAFDPSVSSLDKNPVGYLLEHSQRQKTASELNAAILSCQCQEKGKLFRSTDPKLPQLLRMLVWSQRQLSEKVNFPQIKDFSTAHLLFQEDSPL